MSGLWPVDCPFPGPTSCTGDPIPVPRRVTSARLWPRPTTARKWRASAEMPRSCLRLWPCLAKTAILSSNGCTGSRKFSVIEEPTSWSNPPHNPVIPSLWPLTPLNLPVQWRQPRSRPSRRRSRQRRLCRLAPSPSQDRPPPKPRPWPSSARSDNPQPLPSGPPRCRAGLRLSRRCTRRRISPAQPICPRRNPWMARHARLPPAASRVATSAFSSAFS